MRWRNSTTNWGAIAKALHWILALLILGNLALGYWADELGRSPEKTQAFYWHKTIGLTVLWLAVLRLLWRFSSRIPMLPANMPAWQRYAAHLSHFLLYVVMFAMPLSGWVIHSASDRPLQLYGWFAVPDIVGASGERAEAIGELAAVVHYYLFILLCALIVLHVLGALKHHFVDGDAVMQRMAPFSRASDPIRGE